MNLKPSQSPPIVPHVLVVGDRVIHKKSPNASGKVVRLVGNKAYVQWELQGNPVAYRLDNLEIATPDLRPQETISRQPSYGALVKRIWKQGEKFVMRCVYNADYSNVHEITGVVLEDCEYPGTAQVEYYHPKSKKLTTELVPVANLFPILPPEEVAVIDYGNTEKPFKIGDRVIFNQVWNGEAHQFEGTVQKVNEPPGTALVQYQTPEHLDDGVDCSNTIQSPIALFSLSHALPPEPSFHVEKPDLKHRRRLRDHAIKLPPEPAYSFGTDKFLDLPLESLEDQINGKISLIRTQGTVAPAGVWIESSAVGHTDFKQVYWRSREPCFTPKKGINPEAKLKRQYIGKEGSDAHKAAIAQVQRRNQIKKLIKQLPKADAE